MRGALAAWFLVAFAYAIAFAQRVSPQTLVEVLRRDFGASGADVGVLASSYFYGYMAMQIPAGILVDVLGVRRAMVLSLAVSAAGTMLFAAAPNLPFAFGARLVVACSDAVVFAALLKYVAQNFPDRRFGLMSGLSQVSGYLGGIVATMPLALAVTLWGWRPSFWAAAAAIVANALLIQLLVRAEPLRRGPRGLGREVAAGVGEAAARMLSFLRTRAAWGSAACFASYFVAAMSLSGVWGFQILMEGFALDRVEAAAVMSLVLFATMLGSVAGGYFSDRLPLGILPSLSACALLRTLCLLPLAPAIGLPLGVAAVEAALILFGFVGGATLPLVFRTLKRIYTPAHIGIGTAINSTVAGICAALAQPLIGGIVDLGARTPQQGWGLVAALLVASSLPGVVAPLWMRRQFAAQQASA